MYIICVATISISCNAYSYVSLISAVGLHSDEINFMYEVTNRKAVKIFLFSSLERTFVRSLITFAVLLYELQIAP